MNNTELMKLASKWVDAASNASRTTIYFGSDSAIAQSRESERDVAKKAFTAALEALEATNSANIATCKGIIQGLQAEVGRFKADWQSTNALLLQRSADLVTAQAQLAAAQASESWLAEVNRGMYEKVTEQRKQLAAVQGQIPVAYQYQARDGSWHPFLNGKHKADTEADGTWPIRALYAAPIPQQPGTSGIEFTPDEKQALIEVLLLAGHTTDDFEPECPACTARVKLAAAPQPKEKQ